MKTPRLAGPPAPAVGRLFRPELSFEPNSHVSHKSLIACELARYFLDGADFMNNIT